MSKIFVTSDTHGEVDFHKLNNNKFPEGLSLTKEDYVIICGDFGAVWDGSNIDNYILNWYNKKPWTTLFIDGNHEGFDLLNKYPIDQWRGGKIQRITPSIIHLMRGQIFVIDDFKFFTMGGAKSHDMEYRTEGRNWWSEEMPNNEELQEGIDNLNKHNWNVDYIISHCAPSSLIGKINPYFGQDKLTRYLDFITTTADYKHHYLGHYHIDKDIDEKITILYNKILRIK